MSSPMTKKAIHAPASDHMTDAEKDKAKQIEDLVNMGLGVAGGLEATGEWVPTSFFQKLFVTLEDPTYSMISKYISHGIMMMIVLGCVTFVLESMRVRV